MLTLVAGRADNVLEINESEISAFKVLCGQDPLPAPPYGFILDMRDMSIQFFRLHSVALKRPCILKEAR